MCTFFVGVCKNLNSPICGCLQKLEFSNLHAIWFERDDLDLNKLLLSTKCWPPAWDSMFNSDRYGFASRTWSTNTCRVIGSDSRSPTEPWSRLKDAMRMKDSGLEDLNVLGWYLFLASLRIIMGEAHAVHAWSAGDLILLKVVHGIAVGIYSQDCYDMFRQNQFRIHINFPFPLRLAGRTHPSVWVKVKCHNGSRKAMSTKVIPDLSAALTLASWWWEQQGKQEEQELRRERRNFRKGHIYDLAQFESKFSALEHVSHRF